MVHSKVDTLVKHGETNVMSGDGWMYPYQRTPMGNPYISPIARGYLWVIIPFGIPREHNKYHGYTVRGTPNCPLIMCGWDGK